MKVCTSRTAARSLLAALLVLSVMGADGGCVRSDRPPSERKADPRRSREVVLRISHASGPYTVTARAGEVGQPLGDWTKEESVGTRYRQTLTYTSGISIEVRMFVVGHRDDFFGCVIEDGPHNRDSRRGYGQVECRLVTQR